MNKKIQELKEQLKQKDRIIAGQEIELKAKDDEIYLISQQLERAKKESQ